MKLTLVFPEEETFDDDTQCFVTCPYTEVQLEHSLFTIAQWEEKIHIPFTESDKSPEQLGAYIRIMSDNKLTDDLVRRMNQEHYDQIREFIANPATATTISDNNPKQMGKPSRETVTAELLYWQMFYYGIPLECQHWHINRLTTLLKICNIKDQEMNNPNKGGMPNINALTNRSSLNSARRAAMGTRG